MAELGRWMSPAFTRQPPGMIHDDYVAWKPWILGPGRGWPEYAYDVELYTQALPANETDPGMLRLWARNTAKRIDAVGRRAGVYTLFEARKITGWSAIAQLKGYEMLWYLNFPTLRLEALWIITTSIDDAMRASAAGQGVRVWVVGEPPPA